MDLVDAEILKLLSDNSRETYLALSELVGLRDTTIRKRIMSLEEDGIVKKYTLLVDPDKFPAILSCAVIDINPAYMRESRDYFMAIDKISQIFYTFSGKIVCFISAVDDSDLSDILKEISQIPGVGEIKLMGDLRIMKYDSLISPSTIYQTLENEKNGRD